MRSTCILTALLLAGCGGSSRLGGPGGGGHGDLGGHLGGGGDGGTTMNGGGDGGGQAGCASEPKGCYTVYAHSDHVLYLIDLQAKSLVEVGPFNAPQVPYGTKMEEDVITDLAVSPSNVIYVVSNTNLYTASAQDGHVTLVGPITACGDKGVALTFTPDGKLY